MKMFIKRGLLGLALIILLVSAFAWYRLNYRVVSTTPNPPPPYLPLDLPRPDALIVTQSLSQLPRDLLKAPLLKDLLSEDFVFYYEQTEDRLNLAGTLRRIAYEHELNFGDEILAYLFNTAAHVALWKGHDGSLKHYLMLIDRGGLVKALETLSKVVLNDEQLKLRSDLTLADGAKLTVYELKYGFRRSLFFADYRGYLLAFSDARLLLPEEPAKKAEVEKFLAQVKPYQVFRERFKLGDDPHTHTLAISAEYLSFGYQRFFPAIEGLRFDFAPDYWTAAALLTGDLPDMGALWRITPTAPALCVALPVDTATLTEIMRQIAPGEAEQQLLQTLIPPAAICWYRRSRLFTPLVLIKTAKTDIALLKTLFEKTVGDLEAGIPAPTPVQAEMTEPANPAPTPQRPRKSYHPPFAVSEQNCPDGMIWRREVSSRYGRYDAKTSPVAEQMRSSRFFAVTLAYCEQTLLFSPDDALVNNAVAVLARTYPALSDSLPSSRNVAAVIVPESLTELLTAELLESLPDAQEPVFRASVSRYLLPQLEKVKKFPPYALQLSASQVGWAPIQWQTLAAP
jgi:uncharacterized protein YfaA (DUF2138 family)